MPHVGMPAQPDGLKMFSLSQCDVDGSQEDLETWRESVSRMLEGTKREVEELQQVPPKNFLNSMVGLSSPSGGSA